MRAGIPSGSEIINKSRETFVRFPLAWITSMLVALISVYLIEIEPKKMEGFNFILSRIALSGSLGVFVFTAVRLWSEQVSKQWRKGWMFLSVAGIVAYYFILPDTSADLNVGMIIFRHFFLSLLFLLAFLWAPFTRDDLENVDFWEYAKQLLFALMMAFLFTFIAILGINGAIFAIEKLFDMEIDGKRYFQVDIVITGLFSVGYFLSQISQHPLASRFSTQPPKVERFFTKWLLTPLSGLYFVILYAYTAKVLVTMDWPKGILAWLIVIFSTVAILTYLFWTHFAKEKSGRWRRWIWMAVLLQTVMLFIAIGIRISAYSWTESRYMVFVLGVWLAGISLYFLFFRHARIKWIFISLSLLIAVTQFGPFNAYSVGRQAQMERLKKHIKKLKTYTVAAKAPVKLRYEVSDGVAYLYRRYRGESLNVLFPEITRAFYLMKAEREAASKGSKGHKVSSPAIYNKPSYLPRYITEELGFKFVNRWEYRSAKKGKHTNVELNTEIPMGTNSQSMLEVKGYDYLTNISRYGYEMVERDKKLKDITWQTVSPKLSFIFTKTFKLHIIKGEVEVVFDLKKRLEALVMQYGNHPKNLKKEHLTFQKRLSKIRVKLVLGNLGRRSVREREVIHFTGVLLVGTDTKERK